MKITKFGNEVPRKVHRYKELVIVDGTPVILDTERRRERFKSESESGVGRLTEMQKRALENHFVKGMTKTQAMEKAGYSMTSHNTKSINNALQKRPIVEALERKKITHDVVAGVIGEGLKAMRPDDHKYPDHTARAPYVREVNRILGNYAPTKIQTEQKSLVVHLTADDAVKFEKFQRMRKGIAGNEDRAD